MLVDYHTHLLGHQDRAGTAQEIREFLEQAVKNNIAEIGFTDHNRYYKEFNFDLIGEVAQEFPQLKVRKGLEMDFTPGEEEQINNFLDQFNLDYAIGSIHYLDDWMFDHPDYQDEYQNWDVIELYKEYFSYVKQAAKSGLFQILGHLDLIKVFGYKPEADILKIVTPVLEIIAQEDVVIEINTNGFNKPVSEMYPSREILEQAYDLEVKVTLGSDAHCAGRVGENFAMVKKLLADIGYTKIATFKNKKRKMIQL
ncbi:histidinol phosphate phosphatase HisJ family [Halobacteroides halobius DSM 5150]|uniref:Histidinol-phosphatase n=1 Tax=Halobacteroides halobius (strain ATCC 35273 / DSM 5150 / MD-1) TaxID=748449 RepID=L0K7Q0_HALHC|nr:histidinol-phosphatase HisJ family protein [Halobacteroides halobius]AGB40374.1 histidinol phosphate phosphatase HisJ family [Halobacteroides halobius DSM 5150]